MQKRRKDLARREPPAQRHAYANVECVRQTRRIASALFEVPEQPPHEIDAAHRGKVREEPNTRMNARNPSCESIVDGERAKEEEAWPSSMRANHVRDDTIGIKQRDGSESASVDARGGAPNELRLE